MARGERHFRLSTGVVAKMAPQSHIRAERGAILPLFALLLVSLFGIAALLVDISRQALLSAKLQAAVDAASLAAAHQLDGSLEGWIDAKLAVKSIFDAQRIFEIPQAQLNFLNETTKHAAYFSGDIRGRAAEYGPLQLVIERGFVKKNSSGSSDFVSLEGIKYFGASNINSFVLADTVRVDVELSNLATTFARVLGFNEMPLLRRSALATIQQQGQIEVLPIGIPLCELALNLNPEVYFSNPEKRFVFEQEQQCTREVLAIEANPYTSESRHNGLTRAELYPRPPYFTFNSHNYNACSPTDGQTKAIEEDKELGDSSSSYYNGQNCLATPIHAVLGLPGRTSPTSPGELAQALKGLGHGKAVLSSPGESFGPLLAAVDADGRPIDQYESYFDNQDVREALLRFINDKSLTPATNKSLTEVFYDSTGKEKKNFPFIRELLGNNDYSELSISLPRQPLPGQLPGYYNIVNDIIRMPPRQILPIREETGRAGHRVWTNPACHTSGIPITHPSQEGAPEPRVRQVKLMVINSEQIDFCGQKNRFYSKEGGLSRDTRGVSLPVSKPGVNISVVGFVTANLLDFNFDSQGDKTPAFGLSIDADNAPWEISTYNNYGWGGSSGSGLDMLHRSLSNDLNNLRNNIKSCLFSSGQCEVCSKPLSDNSLAHWCHDKCKCNRCKFDNVYTPFEQQLPELFNTIMDSVKTAVINLPDYQKECFSLLPVLRTVPHKDPETAEWIYDWADNPGEFLYEYARLLSANHNNNSCLVGQSLLTKDDLPVIDQLITQLDGLVSGKDGRELLPASPIPGMNWPLNWSAQWPKGALQCLPQLKTECIPQLRNGEALYSTPRDPECWEVKARRSSYSCGGMRLKLDCAEGKRSSLSAGSEKGKAKPVLISN